MYLCVQICWTYIRKVTQSLVLACMKTMPKRWIIYSSAPPKKDRAAFKRRCSSLSFNRSLIQKLPQSKETTTSSINMHQLYSRAVPLLMTCFVITESTQRIKQLDVVVFKMKAATIAQLIMNWSITSCPLGTGCIPGKLDTNMDGLETLVRTFLANALTKNNND